MQNAMFRMVSDNEERKDKAKIDSLSVDLRKAQTDLHELETEMKTSKHAQKNYETELESLQKRLRETVKEKS